MRITSDISFLLLGWKRSRIDLINDLTFNQYVYYSGNYVIYLSHWINFDIKSENKFKYYALLLR